MDRSIVFELLTVERQQNSIGAYTETVTEKKVYGGIQSVSRDEFFAGGQNGFKPEYRITMFGPDYGGQMRCRIDGGFASFAFQMAMVLLNPLHSPPPWPYRKRLRHLPA